jgi:hypothetical protein
MCVWGGGALLIRYAVRRWQLGWPGMLCLAIVLAIAEECLIQQTSLAPMVIHLKGVVYARAFGVNYVYFLWALIYEPVFVVFLSVYAVELIFPARREGLWVGKGWLFLIVPLFIAGSLLAWFSWTQIARVKVFHLQAYHPPLAAVISAVAAILILFYLAFARLNKKKAIQPITPPMNWLLALGGAVWATLLFGLVLLGFGIDPDFPPAIAVAGGLVLAITPIAILPKLTSHAQWGARQQFTLVCGTVTGSMLAGQLGFIGTTGPDLYFKVLSNVIAIGLLIVLGLKTWKRTASGN